MTRHFEPRYSGGSYPQGLYRLWLCALLFSLKGGLAGLRQRLVMSLLGTRIRSC